MSDLVAEHHVGLLMVYRDWFPGQVPSSWTSIGRLTGAPRYTSAEQSVDLIVTRPADVATACRDLTAFARDVPAPTRVTTYSICR